ncbi:hypothetical protein GCM10027195_25090 [Comamonas sediminis]
MGGSTSGNVTTAPMGPRQRDGVCASHQASGVASTSSKIVVKLASSSVSQMAAQSSGLRKEVLTAGGGWQGGNKGEGAAPMVHAQRGRGKRNV